MPRSIMYDVNHFAPIPHRVRLTNVSSPQHWQDKGWWPIGLDWRPGGPTFLSNRALTMLYDRLVLAYDLHRKPQEDQAEFFLLVTRMDEDGREREICFFAPTVPIDDRDEQEYRTWLSAAA